MSETAFKITKETYTYVWCGSCQGAGYKVKKFKGGSMKEVCRTCRGSCREKITHQTEVTLQEALKEIGVINQID